MELDPRLLLPHLAIASQEDLFAHVARLLRDLGFVGATYHEALLAREAVFPTGLAVPAGGVALPHTDASHVRRDALAVVTLIRPILFAPMGGDAADEPVAVTTVLFLVVSDPSRQVDSLSRTVHAIQSDDFLLRLQAAETPAGLHAVLTNQLGLSRPTAPSPDTHTHPKE
ncbi:MAG: PTS sugar transporter subunit IIA [Propionibacteriaceae bacterium]|jgi:PTS system galactitol-specific IIA component|nr:PTS sugar transporter subunit IIA [Propionibacteriaceae bacterium]